MHVPVNDAVRVKMGDGGGKLSKNAEHLLGREFLLAETFPCCHMIGRFGLEDYSLNFVKENGWLDKVQDVWMVYALQFGH